MWGHRIVGVTLFGVGLVGMITLFGLLYSPAPAAVQASLTVGIPIILVAGLGGLASMVFGFWFTVAPEHATKHVTGVFRPLP